MEVSMKYTIMNILKTDCFKVKYAYTEQVLKAVEKYFMEMICIFMPKGLK